VNRLTYCNWKILICAHCPSDKPDYRR
jgi:hypothetical protein